MPLIDNSTKPDLPNRELRKMSWLQALFEAKRIRQAIRLHNSRETKYWIDDELLYRVLPKAAPADYTLPQLTEHVANCNKFYHDCANRGEAFEEDKQGSLKHFRITTPLPATSLEELKVPVKQRPDLDLYDKTKEELVGIILELRASIQKHHDQKGHDRCYIDDFSYLYHHLPEHRGKEVKVASLEEHKKRCEEFRTLRMIRKS